MKITGFFRTIFEFSSWLSDPINWEKSRFSFAAASTFLLDVSANALTLQNGRLNRSKCQCGHCGTMNMHISNDESVARL